VPRVRAHSAIAVSTPEDGGNAGTAKGIGKLAGPGRAAADPSALTAGTVAEAMKGLSCPASTPAWPPVSDRPGFGAMPCDGVWAGAGIPCPVGVGSSTILFAVQSRSNGSSGLTRLHQTMTASILLLRLTTCNCTPLGVGIWAAQQGSRGCGDRAGRRFRDGGAAATDKFHACGSECVLSSALCVMAGD